MIKNIKGWKQYNLSVSPEYTEYRPITKTQFVLTTLGIILYVLLIGLIA
jgi:hypothetical protein